MSTRTKRRVYGDDFALSTSFPFGTGTGVVATHHFNPGSSHSTFLRLRAEAEVTVDVNGPTFDIPPEFWWSQTFLHLNAFWVPSLSTAHQPSTGNSEHYLGSVTLKPRLYAAAAVAGEYSVIWTSEEPLICRTARQSPTATVGPTILFQIDGIDPGEVLAMNYADVSVNYYTRTFTLWEDPP